MTQQPSLSDMAGTMGLVLPPSDPAYSATVDTATNHPETETNLDLDEFIDQDSANPEQHRSMHAFYNSGWAKALLVGGTSLSICLGGAAIFRVTTPKGTVADNPKPDNEFDEDSSQSALEAAQLSASQTSAQLALQTQQQEMRRLAEAEFSEDEPSAPNKLPKAPSKTTSPIKPSKTTTTVTKPAPPPPARVVKPATLPQSVSKSMTPAPTTRPTVISPPLSHNTALRQVTVDSVDPMAEWQRLASLGRYGVVDASTPTDAPASTPTLSNAIATEGGEKSDPPTTTSPESAAVASTVASVFAPAPGLGNGSGNVFEPEQPAASPNSTIAVAAKANITKVKPPSSAPAAPLSDYFAGASTIRQTYEEGGLSTLTDPPPSSRSLLVGRSALGETVTPILWAPDTTQSDARFVLQLSEALADRQGNPALPAGTQIIIRARSVDTTSGFAELEVVSILIDGAEFSPPAGAFSVRDESGGLLLGQSLHRGSGSSTGHDLWRIAAGALGQAGALMNQPRRTSSSSITTGTGSSLSETIERDDPNYLGAALEGGFDALSEVMDQRQQAAAKQLAEAPQLYHLPAGHRIRIFVNQSMSF